MSRSYDHCAKPVALVARQTPDGGEGIVSLLLKRDKNLVPAADNRSDEGGIQDEKGGLTS
jgi:hypothetical protein